MIDKQKNITEILHPINQLSLYGYKNYFNSLKTLFDKKKLPNSLLISGPKGTGKSTFIFHFVNYLLSLKEKNNYSYDELRINSENTSYKLINNNTHPNVFLDDINSSGKDIKIEEVRKLINFINKSTYLNDLKIVIIDNAEKLNLNSSNALLKAIEEPSSNTFFFIIHDNAYKILDTIKSRCIEFKIFLKLSEKKHIYSKLLTQYECEKPSNEIIDILQFNTPGSLLKYSLSISEFDIDISNNNLENILTLMKIYENKKTNDILEYLIFSIAKFYNYLCLKNFKNINTYIYSYQTIMEQINNMKKFKLSEKNVLNCVNEILINDTQ